jgi:hypothetical protein
MDKERLYPLIEAVEKSLADFKPGEANQDARGACSRFLQGFEQEHEMPPKAGEVLKRVKSNFEMLFSSSTKFESYGGWKNIAHSIGCDMARLKMVVTMNADKK